MPPLRLLLRILLIAVLCMDGISSAWAATRMAMNDAESAAILDGMRVENERDGDHGRHVQAKAKAAAKWQAGKPVATGGACLIDEGAAGGGGGGSHHDGCDCGSATTCACSCVLTFYPGRGAALFAAQHALDAPDLVPPLLPEVRSTVSRVFRPPIG